MGAISTSSPDLWLKADAITGLSDGAAVASWVDSSGNSRDGSQATSGNRPTFKTGILNSLPVVRFNGSSHYLASTASTSAAGQTVIALVNVTGSGYREIRGANNNGGLMLRVDSGSNKPHADLQAAAVLGDASTALTAGWHLLVMTYTAGALSFRVDGVNDVYALSTGAPTAGLTTIIGSRIASGSPGEFFSGDMAELLSWSRVLTAAEIAGVEAEIAAKWALTGQKGHTAITSVTATATTSAGGWDPYKLFDGVVSSGATNSWSAAGVPTQTLKAQLSAAAAITSYKIGARTDAASSAPAAWTFEGSNDDTNWTTLDTRSGQSWTAGQVQTYTLANLTAYRYYRLVMTATMAGGAAWPSFSEWTLVQSDAVGAAVTTGTSPVSVGSSSAAVTVPVTTGSSPVDVGSSSTSSLVGGVPVTTGTSPVDVGSSAAAELVVSVTTTTGDSPVSVGSSSSAMALLTTTGTSPVSVGSSSSAFDPATDILTAHWETSAVADPGTDLAGITATETLTGAWETTASADPGTPMSSEVLTAGWQTWLRVLGDYAASPDPTTKLPRYKTVAVLRDGTEVCTVDRAKMGIPRRTMNGLGSFSFDLGKNDPKAAAIGQLSEVQVWRGSHLIPGGWYVVADKPRDIGSNRIQFGCSGLAWHFESKVIGKELPELVTNGGFEQGLLGWRRGWAAGSNAETPPLTEIITSALEGGKAVRVHADDKVETVTKVLETRGIFEGNRSTFLPGGEQFIRDAVEDIPDGTHVLVEGHTADADGGTGYDLSVARAEAAAAVIHAYKPTLVLTTVGLGETDPLDLRHNEDAYRKNRRVAIIANVTQTKVGHRQFLEAWFDIAAGPLPLDVDITAQMRIDTYEGDSKDGNGLTVTVAPVADLERIVSDGEYPIDETTARGVWVPMHVRVTVPAGTGMHRVIIQLYPTAGASSFDQVSATPNLVLSFIDKDPTIIIRDLVAEAQNTAHGKADLGIIGFGYLTGHTVQKSWEWARRESIADCIRELTSADDGPDANMEVGQRIRRLTVAQKQGRSNGVVLAFGNRHGDARILDYSLGVDGDDLASVAYVQSSWSAGGQAEHVERLTRPDGLVLERTYQAEQNAPSSTLRELGRTAVRYGRSDVVTQVVMAAGPGGTGTTWLLDNVTLGDVVTIDVHDGATAVLDKYRIIEVAIDPGTDQITYLLAAEV